MVRSLEPRFVLNATAELVGGVLQITGTETVDMLSLEVKPDGVVVKDDGVEIQIREQGNVKPSPLGFDEFSEITFDTLGGNDLLDLELPSGIDVSVFDSPGSDRTNIEYTMMGPAGERDITIETEQIEVHAQVPHGRGTLTVGTTRGLTQLTLQAGGLGVDGSLQLAGNVNVTFDGSNRLDLSDAIVTANAEDLTLGIVGEGDTNIQIGGADRLGNLKLDSVGDVILGPRPLELDGELTLTNGDGEFDFRSRAVADEVNINTAGDISVEDTVESRGRDGIRMSTDGSIIVSGELKSSSDDSLLAIRLSSGNTDPQQDSIRLENTVIRANEGLVQFDGKTTIAGDVRVESGKTIEFLDPIVSADQGGDRLILQGKTVRLRGDVGGDEGPNLNELFIDANLIVTQSLGVTGDIVLNSDDTRLQGPELRSTGSIVFNSQVLLPVGDTSIVADGSVTFRQKVEGQAGGGDLNVMGSRIRVEDFIDTSRGVANHVVTLKSTTGPIELGFIDAGDADVELRAATTIDDVIAEQSPNVAARRLVMSASQGIGNQSPIELSRIAVLEATTVTGEIDLRLDASRPTVVDTLEVSEQGNIRLYQQGLGDTAPIRLEMARTGNGSIDVDAGGSITVISVISQNRDASDDTNPQAPSRDVTLRARGSRSDIIVDELLAKNTADVQLIAGDDIFDSDLLDSKRIEADDLTLVADNRQPDRAAAIELSTNVEELQARVTGPARGDLIITEVDSITLASSDARGDEIIETDNGQIKVAAGDQIRVSDFDTADEGPELKDDPEVVARGTEGRIDFQAGECITLDDAVQLHAEKQTVRSLQPFILNDPIAMSPETPEVENPEVEALRAVSPEAQALQTEFRMVVAREDAAVYLQAGNEPESGTITLGERIEINTGENQGVARFFAPRPGEIDDLDPSEQDAPKTAFYDVQSVRTNILEQADVNNAVGILTLNIGQTGERGLTLNIDWGAPTLRFQQIDDIPADTAIFIPRLDLESDPTPNDGLTRLVEIDPDDMAGEAGDLSVAHKYTEADILFSEFNDRESETKPLEVRFSVRHHESIVVLGATVVQGDVGTPQDAQNQAAVLPEEIAEPEDRVPPNLPVTEGQDLLRVVSATDNDNPTIQDQNRILTHNNGNISFLIPSLTIPVAFFPVRDVLPEFEKVELVVREETPVVTTQAGFETVEVISVANITGNEFFQIRAISPDPDAPRSEPVPLPNQILDIESLRRFLAGTEDREGLPDGEYEIEYVLPSESTRTIFRFNLRNGDPTSPDDGLNEGVLRLKDLIKETPSEDSGETSEEADELPPPMEELLVPPVPADAANGPSEETAAPDESSAAAMLLPLSLRMRRRGRQISSTRLSAAGRFAAKREEQSRHRCG